LKVSKKIKMQTSMAATASRASFTIFGMANPSHVPGWQRKGSHSISAAGNCAEKHQRMGYQPPDGRDARGGHRRLNHWDRRRSAADHSPLGTDQKPRSHG
jgi:hypothetical protein